MHRIFIPLFSALLLAAVGTGGAAEEDSWQGSVSTKSGEDFEGELLFAKDKLLVHPGESTETAIAFDQIYKLRFHGRENVGNEPRSEEEREIQNGLFAEYYGGKNLDGHRQTRIDRTIDFHWGHSAPMGGIPADQFSVRWSGVIKGPVSGKVTFTTSSDDGARLWVGEKEVINVWTDHATAEYSGEFEMEAGKRYPIRVEYYESASEAEMHLTWSGPGLAKQIVPTDHLFNEGIASKSESVVGKQRVWLRGGSNLRGTVIGFDEKFLEFAIEGGVLRLPVAALATVDFLGYWDTPESLSKYPAGVYLRQNSEFLQSEIKGMDEAGKVEVFSSLFGKRLFSPSEVRAIKFGELEKEPGALRIRTGSWSYIIRADRVVSKGERLIVRDSSGQYLILPLSVIFGIEAFEEEEKAEGDS